MAYGYCKCGCGGKTNISKQTRAPYDFIQHHHDRKSLGTPIEDKYSPEPMSGCWLWLAGANDDGYGIVWNRERKRLQSAHRYIYEMLVGPVPDDLDLDHLCRTPPCVNPSHLEPVTRTINAHRGSKSILTMNKAREIRDLRIQGVSNKDIASLFLVHPATVSSVIAGTRWKEAA